MVIKPCFVGNPPFFHSTCFEDDFFQYEKSTNLPEAFRVPISPHLRLKNSVFSHFNWPLIRLIAVYFFQIVNSNLLFHENQLYYYNTIGYHKIVHLYWHFRKTNCRHNLLCACKVILNNMCVFFFIQKAFSLSQSRAQWFDCLKSACLSVPNTK